MRGEQIGVLDRRSAIRCEENGAMRTGVIKEIVVTSTGRGAFVVGGLWYRRQSLRVMVSI
jgi:hypothetical protein